VQAAAIEARRDVRDAAREPAQVLVAPIKILDLCSGTALVETTEWLAPGRRHCLRLIPGVLLTGTVTSAALKRLEGTKPPRAFYDIGFRFDAPTPEGRRGLMRLIDALQRLGPADPLPLTVRIA
jgi:hypothetical protein